MKPEVSTVIIYLIFTSNATTNLTQQNGTLENDASRMQRTFDIRFKNPWLKTTSKYTPDAQNIDLTLPRQLYKYKQLLCKTVMSTKINNLNEEISEVNYIRKEQKIWRKETIMTYTHPQKIIPINLISIKSPC